VATTYVRRIGLSDSASFTTVRRTSRKLSASLWTIQALLALIFVMTGAMKLLMPADMLAAQSPLPVIVSRFVGLCELAGALGLILPGLLRIRPILTSLAAVGLVVLMICATVLTPILISPDPLMMSLPATVGALAGFVAYARLRIAPIRAR
jgi:uncharacterized membrane protein YphA (DoxX/SURF4 family)